MRTACRRRPQPKPQPLTTTLTPTLTPGGFQGSQCEKWLSRLGVYAHGKKASAFDLSVALVRATTMKSMMKTLGRCVVVALVSLSAACGQSGTSTSTTAPSTTAPPSAVEAFSGTLQPTGTNLHRFTVKETGYVEITLLGVVPQLVAGPSAPITVGLGIGTPNPATGTCLVLYQVNAQPGSAG